MQREPRGSGRRMGTGVRRWMMAGATLVALCATSRPALAQSPIACGQTIIGDITAIGSASGSEIEVTYDAQEAGQVITLEGRTVTAVDPGFTPCLQLIAPAGGLIGGPICDGNQKRTLVSAGTHRVRVRDQNRDDRGRFAMTLQVVDEHGNCAVPIACGVEDSGGAITQPGGSVALRFAGVDGERISLSLAATGTGDPGFEPCEELYAPNGALVGTRSCSRREQLLPQTGTYTAIISAGDHVSQGSFHASFQGLSAANACAAPVLCDGVTTGALAEPGDTDTFRFSAAVDDGAAIHLGTTTKTDPAFEACMDVWSPTGKHPVSPTCGPVTLRAAETGDYTVQVFAKNQGDRGAYRLSYQAGTQATNCGVPLACGIAQRAEIDEPGDSDAFAFDSQPGVVAIQVSASTVGTNDVVPKWWLFNPDGVRAQMARQGLAVISLSTPGTHTLVIADENDDEIGEYVVEMEGVSSGLRCGPTIGCGGVGALGRIESRADIDTYAFEAAAGDQVRIDVTSEGVNNLPEFTPCWSAYDSTGNVILGQQCGFVELTFGVTGTYVILVHDSRGDAVGDYRVTLTGACPPGPDADADGVSDAVDNCPTRANSGQEDTGGVGVGSLPDGTGDACQCGDATGDGRVTIGDAVTISRSLLVPPSATMAAPGNCDANGSMTCSIADAVVVRRALLTPPIAVIDPHCATAPPGVP